MNRFTLTLAASVAALSLAACATTDDDFDAPIVTEDAMIAKDDMMADAMMDDDVMMAEPDLMAPTQTAMQLIDGSPDHTLFAEALRASGLLAQMEALDGGFTIFAPTNAAFERLPAGAFDELAQYNDGLELLINNHVLDGRYLALDVIEAIPASGMLTLPTRGDTDLSIMRSGESFRLIDYDNILVPVLTADLIGTDGVVHSIDYVLTPVVPDRGFEN